MATVTWQNVPGPPAKDIGAGAWGAVWIVHAGGQGEVYSGFPYRRVGQGWTIVPRAAVDSRSTRIAVAPNGQAWTIYSVGTSTGVYVYGAGLNAAVPSAPPLQARSVYSPEAVGPISLLHGTPIDIGVGSLDTAWAIAPDLPELERTSLLRWDGFQWARFWDSVSRVAVEPNGTPWVLRDDGRVTRLDGDDWTWIGRIHADDIGVGANGEAWVISGGMVYFWDGTTWEQVIDPSFALVPAAIAVSPEGKPWIVDQYGRIFTLA